MKNTCEGFNLPFFCRSYLKLIFHPPITYDRHFENLWCRLPSYHILIFNATQNQTHRNSSVNLLWKFNTNLIFLFFYRYNLSDRFRSNYYSKLKYYFSRCNYITFLSRWKQDRYAIIIALPLTRIDPSRPAKIILSNKTRTHIHAQTVHTLRITRTNASPRSQPA